MLTFIVAMLASPTDDAVRWAEKWSKKAETFSACADENDCAAKWSKARKWVIENSRFSIRVDQPDLLSTSGAIYANTDLSFTLSKTGNSRDGYKLNAYIWCGNIITCSPKPKSALRALAAAVQ